MDLRWQKEAPNHWRSLSILSPQINVKRSDAQGIPPPGGRQRTNSVSSTNSGSSSWGSSSPSSVSPPGAELNIPPRRSNIMERSRWVIFDPGEPCLEFKIWWGVVCAKWHLCFRWIVVPFSRFLEFVNSQSEACSDHSQAPNLLRSEKRFWRCRDLGSKLYK